MNTTMNFFKKAGIALACTAVLASCQKEQLNTGQGNYTPSSLNEDEKRAFVELARRVPSKVRVYDENDNRFIDVDFRARTLEFKDANDRDFTFASPSPGWDFSSSDDVLWAPAEDGGGILFIGSGAFGGNTGGTVVAGSTALDINYSFCFSASDEALGLDLFDTGAGIEGISGVIGIAGDFEALMNDEVGEDADFTDFFQGFAAYFVYADEAQGSYEILNWLTDLEEEADVLADKGFSYVFGFEDGSFYLSSGGTMTVSGGSMSFNGEYWGIIGLFDELFGDDSDLDDAEVEDVSGFGQMGC
jgi:hypothetical protein